MLIVPRGRPLIVESRLPPGVDTPGMNVTKSIALLDVSGSFVIWLLLIVVEMCDDCVCRISDADVTVMTSSSPPTSSGARTAAPTPDVNTTLFAMNVLKPCSETVTVYAPMLRPGNEKTPSALLTVDVVTPVALCCATMVAPGMTPPLVSTTTPDSVEVVLPWPKTGDPRASKPRITAHTTPLDLMPLIPPSRRANGPNPTGCLLLRSTKFV